MAFCKYCGKELEAEQLCDCEQAVASRMAKEQPTETEASQLQEQNKNNGKAFSDKAKEIWTTFYGVVKHPKTAGTSFVNDGHYQDAIVFIALQAVLSGFFALMIIRKINSLIALGGGYLDSIKFSGARAFFVTILFSLILSAALIVIYWGILKLLKIKADMKVPLKLIAVRSIGIIPFILISYVGFALNIPFGIIVFIFSSLIGYLFLYSSISTLGAEDKQPYMAFLSIGIMMIVFSLLATKGYVMYLPDSIKEVLKQVGSIPDLIDMLGSF